MASEDNLDAAAFISSLAIVLNPLLHRCGGEIAACADFVISGEQERPFVDLIKWINERPNFIVVWRSSPDLENTKYRRFMSGLKHARNAFRAVGYHLQNLTSIENEISNILSRYNLSANVPTGSAHSLGPTLKWDFEYQAFVLQYRACLEYLTIGIGTYFDSEVKSFPKFQQVLEQSNNSTVAETLLPVWRNAVVQFKFIASVRDQLAHHGAIPAGTINVTSKGYRYIGGGEDMGIADRDDNRGLAERLDARMIELGEFVSICLSTFQTAVIAAECNGSSN